MAHSSNLNEWIILDRLSDIILSAVEGCVVDIGAGLSTLVLAKYSKSFNRIHYSCDTSKKRFIVGHGCHKSHKYFIGTSLDFMEQFNDVPALVFIDGTHEYDIVTKEVNFFLEKLNKGGVLFLHDTYPPHKKYINKKDKGCGQIYLIRQQLENNKDFWCFTWPYSSQAQGCGLTMVMKKYDNLPFYLK